VPIPGTKRVTQLEENAAAVDIELSGEELRRLDDAVPLGGAEGDRHPDMSTVHQ
jgi:aryl-alcohol dehydrogenase-like predicted oxidoreductase